MGQPGEHGYRPGLEGVVAAETRVSYLDLDREVIWVRGYSLIDLARHTGYVEVVGLLLDGSLPDAAGRQRLEEALRVVAEPPPAVLGVLAQLPRSAHPMDRLRTAVSALGCLDPDLESPTPDAVRARALRLVGRLPAVVAALHPETPPPAVRPPGFTARFLAQLTGQLPGEADVRAFDRLLIAYSEHEMPNSTFAARVIASTLADLYGAATGAVASLKGVLHGGANEAVMRLLLEAKDAAGMERRVRGLLAAGQRVMGFGHRVYMRRPDPRALLMKECLLELAPAKGLEELVAACEAGERVMREAKGLFPNLDYYAAPVLYALSIPIELFTPVFFAARSAGLAAHVMEQQAENRLYRPRVRYLGPTERVLP